MNARFLQPLAVLVIVALLGASLAKVGGGNQWLFAVVAVVFATIALCIGRIFRGLTSSFERNTPPRKLLGMRVAMIGFLIATLGWLVGVYIYGPLGFYLAGAGIVAGLIGFPIHYRNIFRK